MQSRKEDEEYCYTKLKTEEKAMTLQQIRTDMSNFGKICLNSGLKVQFGKPVRFPVIRRKRATEIQEECYSSRTSNQTESQLNIRMEDRDASLDEHEDRSNSLATKTIQKENFKIQSKQRSLDAAREAAQQLELIEGSDKASIRKALPKIFRNKYFKQTQRLDRMKSERNVAKVQQIDQLQRYKMGTIIGQGSYATVRVAHSQNGQLVAIKTYEKSKIKDAEKRQNIRREVEILSRLSHPNILQFIEAIETPHSINIVTELLQRTSLMDHIKNNVCGRLEEQQARIIFRQLMSALSYLHDRNIVHRDIKLENILIGKDRSVKLIDFGFSIEENSKLYVFCGTPSYIAPQIITKKGYYGKPADVWSCGIVLYKMLCGAFPFKGLNEKTLYNKISKAVFRFVCDLSMNSQIFINRMLTADPNTRITLEEVMKEPWMLEKS